MILYDSHTHIYIYISCRTIRTIWCWFGNLWESLLFLLRLGKEIKLQSRIERIVVTFRCYVNSILLLSLNEKPYFRAHPFNRINFQFYTRRANNINNEGKREFERTFFYVTVIQTRLYQLDSIKKRKTENIRFVRSERNPCINFISEVIRVTNDTLWNESIIRPIDIRQEIYRIFLGVARATFARRCTRVRIEWAVRPLPPTHLSVSSGRVLLSRPSPPPTPFQRRIHFPRYSDPHYVCIGSRARCGTLVRRVWVDR